MVLISCGHRHTMYFREFQLCELENGHKFYHAELVGLAVNFRAGICQSKSSISLLISDLQPNCCYISHVDIHLSNHIFICCEIKEKIRCILIKPKGTERLYIMIGHVSWRMIGIQNIFI